jgi:hypothetical protein
MATMCSLPSGRAPATLPRPRDAGYRAASPETRPLTRPPHWCRRNSGAGAGRTTTIGPGAGRRRGLRATCVRARGRPGHERHPALDAERGSPSRSTSLTRRWGAWSPLVSGRSSIRPVSPPACTMCIGTRRSPRGSGRSHPVGGTAPSADESRDSHRWAMTFWPPRSSPWRPWPHRSGRAQRSADV